MTDVACRISLSVTAPVPVTTQRRSVNGPRFVLPLITRSKAMRVKYLTRERPVQHPNRPQMRTKRPVPVRDPNGPSYEKNAASQPRVAPNSHFLILTGEEGGRK